MCRPGEGEGDDEDARFFYGDDQADAPRGRKRLIDWEETESERAGFLAGVYSVVGFQLAAAAGGSYFMPVILKNLPVLDTLVSSDKGALKFGGASLLGWLVVTGVLGANGPLRRTFPFNATLLLALTATLAGLSSSVSLQFSTRWPILSLGQSALSMLLASLCAGRGAGEGLAPLGLTAVLTLVPARLLQLALSWPMKEVTAAAASSFVGATMLILSTQTGMKRRVAASSLDGASHVWVDVLRAFFRVATGGGPRARATLR